MSWHEAKSSNWSTSIMAQIFLSELGYTGTFHRSWLISWYQRLEFLRRPRPNARKYQVLESEGCHGSRSCVYPRWQFDCDGSWWQEYRSCQRTSKLVRVHRLSPSNWPRNILLPLLIVYVSARRRLTMVVCSLRISSRCLMVVVSGPAGT